jgi:hypothetical protein
MLKWNGTSWTRVSTPDPGGSDANDTLTAVAAASATSAWAVGDEHTSAAAAATTGRAHAGH